MNTQARPTESSGDSGSSRWLWLHRLWKSGGDQPPPGAVHVSMNDYLIHRKRDIPRVAIAGLRLRHGWQNNEGALGLWMASYSAGRRQVSVSIWRSPEDLRSFVLTPAHRRVMKDFRDAGALYTNSWAAERFDRSLIWDQAWARLTGGVAGVPHH